MEGLDRPVGIVGGDEEMVVMEGGQHVGRNALGRQRRRHRRRQPDGGEGTDRKADCGRLSDARREARAAKRRQLSV